MSDTECNTDDKKKKGLGTNFSKKIDSQSTFLTDIWKPKVKVKGRSIQESCSTSEYEVDNIKSLNSPFSKSGDETKDEFDNGFNVNDEIDYPEDEDTSPDQHNRKFYRNIDWTSFMVGIFAPVVSLFEDVNGERSNEKQDYPDLMNGEKKYHRPPLKPRRMHKSAIVIHSDQFSISFQRSFTTDDILTETRERPNNPSVKMLDVGTEDEIENKKTDANIATETGKPDDINGLQGKRDSSEDEENELSTKHFEMGYTFKMDTMFEQNDNFDNTFSSTLYSDGENSSVNHSKNNGDSMGRNEIFDFSEIPDDMVADFKDEEFQDEFYPEEELLGSVGYNGFPCTCASEGTKEGETQGHICCPRHVRSRMTQFSKSQQMLQDLSRTEGLEIHDVVPDGNCMFRAIVDQLRMNGELQWSCNQIRQRAVSFLRDNPLEKDGTHFEVFLTQDGETWEGYLNRMSKDGEWGDQMILRGLTEVTRKEICIISTIGELHNQTSIAPIKTEKDGKIYLGHVNDQHYYSLRPKGWQSRWYKEARKKRLALDSTEDELLNARGLEIESRAAAGVSFPYKESQLTNCSTEYIDKYSNVPVFHLTFIMKNVLKSASLYTPNRFWTETSPMPKDFKDSYTLVGSAEEDLAVNIYQGIYPTLNRSKQSSNNAVKTSMMPNMYIIADSTNVFFPNDRYELNKDVVIIHASNEHQGYVNLEIQGDMLEYKVNVGGKYFLDSAHYSHLCRKPSIAAKPQSKAFILPFKKTNKMVFCYRCPRWPDEALNWFKRARPSGWPNSVTIRDIKEVPCVLSPVSHPESTHPNIEWMLDFSLAEKFLLKNKITEQQRFCFHAFKLLIDFYTGRNFDLSTFILKTLFLYSLEFITLEQWNSCPSACLLYLLENLHECLKVKTIPHYFIPENNIISHISGEALYFLIERVSVIREFPIMSIVIMAESHGLMSTAVTDHVIEDLNHWSNSRNSIDSILTTFVPAYSKQTASSLATQQFRDASDAAVTGFEMLQEYNRSCNDITNPYLDYTLYRFIDEATGSMYLYQTWWLCFFVDLFHKKDTLASFANKPFKRVKYLFKECPGGPLDNVTVPNFVLKTYSRQTEIFEEVENIEFLITMCSFLSKEKQYVVAAHYIRAIVKQLNSVLNDRDALVVEIERTRGGPVRNIDYVLQTYVTSISLFTYNLLYSLYQCYKGLGHPEYFQEYVEQFESLCHTISTPDSYYYLAQIWKVLGNTCKMREALEKQKSAGY